MPIEKIWTGEIELEKIQIAREERQRKEIRNIDELADSIERVGLINPIIITRAEKNLVAGERRLEAYRLLQSKDPGRWCKIPFRYLDELNQTEAKLVELEENIKRADLDWKEKATAILNLHEAYSKACPTQSIQDTARKLAISSSYASQSITVAKELRDGNERIQDAPGIRAAITILNRAEDRERSNQVNTILSHWPKILKDITKPQEEIEEEEEGGSSDETLDETPSTKSWMEVEDFLKWAPNYSGEKFNFLHCDFPYGINHDKSDLGYTRLHGGYEDSPEIFFDLLACLIENLDRLIFPSAHIMFWFGMKRYEQTKTILQQAGLVVNPLPLIWHKSDNKGILPDPARSARQVYETAFMATRGDRKIVTPVSNLYACSSDKTLHPSEKPIQMLKHFFRMFVDEDTRLLDPTCGSSSALCAALQLSSCTVFGLEKDAELAERGKTRMTSQQLQLEI